MAYIPPTIIPPKPSIKTNPAALALPEQESLQDKLATRVPKSKPNITTKKFKMP